MQSEELRANFSIRQVDEKNLVETAFAQHLRRQGPDVVRSGGEKHDAFTILHPGQKRRQQPLRQSRIRVAAGSGRRKRLFDFVDPQNDRRQFFGQIQRSMQALLAFAHKFVVERSGVQPRQFNSPLAGEWGIELARLDAGSLYDKFVGESEKRLHRALDLAEKLSPVVLWIDEIEKAFASAGTSGDADAGLSQRLLATLLTWMQDRESGVFLAATSNNISALPPEMLRKGRFDEIFFVDLPNTEIRAQ